MRWPFMLKSTCDRKIRAARSEESSKKWHQFHDWMVDVRDLCPGGCENRENRDMTIPERQAIVDIAIENRAYGINDQDIDTHNAYGTYASVCVDCGDTQPIICTHGGSMWLCAKCKSRFIAADKEKARRKNDQITSV